VTDLDTHHVGVTVTDLDRAEAFYRETFGLDVVARFRVAGEAFETAVGVPGATGRFVHLDAGSARIELVEYDPERDGATAESVNHPGVKHLGLEVADLDAFHAALDPSVETVSDPQTTETGTRILFVRDPEGNLIEILEP
jgi:catechol 2,3-dioxygenase-like lactoylglutathione lyase family enzyme